MTLSTIKNFKKTSACCYNLFYMKKYIREISAQEISAKIAAGFTQINYLLPKDISNALKLALDQEEQTLAQETLATIIENEKIAAADNIALCQDTGIAIVLAEIGQDVHITDGDFSEAVNLGIAQGYINLRKSVVKDPLNRINTNNNTPGIIYTQLVAGNQIKFSLMAKGGGAENKSALKMFNPTTEPSEIKKFVIDTVKKADAAACPPLTIGVGLGGSFDYCAFLAKKALLRPIGSHNTIDTYQKMEQELLAEINKLNIGPAGFGGKTTALAVNIESYPCHIASLPVAVNIQCHSARHLEIII